MGHSASVRRLAENEVVYRRLNEQVQEGFDEIKRMASEDKQHIDVDMDDVRLHFYCECSDENCRLRIRMTPRTYNRIHISSQIFTVIPGHEVAAVEEVLKMTKNYYVVRKYVVPPVNATKLRKTDVENV